MRGALAAATFWSWRCSPPLAASLEEPIHPSDLTSELPARLIVIDQTGRYLHTMSRERALSHLDKHATRCSIFVEDGITFLQWHDIVAPRNRRVPRIPRRDLIYARDGWRCQYCLADLAHLPHELTLDHIIPASWFDDRADAWTWENLTTSCRSCNWAKADQSPQQWGYEPYSAAIRPNFDQMERMLLQLALYKALRAQGKITSSAPLERLMVPAIKLAGSSPAPSTVPARGGSDTASMRMSAAYKAMDEAGDTASEPAQLDAGSRPAAGFMASADTDVSEVRQRGAAHCFGSVSSLPTGAENAVQVRPLVMSLQGGSSCSQ